MPETLKDTRNNVTSYTTSNTFDDEQESEAPRILALRLLIAVSPSSNVMWNNPYRQLFV